MTDAPSPSTEPCSKPESIPTASDTKSQRPTKRRALSPKSSQSAHISSLFVKPQELKVPTSLGPRRLPPPPDIVANVQGSSAGAGSGEFHVYKASRRREYARLREMDLATLTEDADEKFHDEKEKRRRADEAKTKKNREKREKAKLRKDKTNDVDKSKEKAKVAEDSGTLSSPATQPTIPQIPDTRKGVAGRKEEIRNTPSPPEIIFEEVESVVIIEEDL